MSAFRFGTRAKFMQSLKDLKNLVAGRDAESSQAKPTSQPANLPGGGPLMKPMNTCHLLIFVLDNTSVSSFDYHFVGHHMTEIIKLKLFVNLFREDRLNLHRVITACLKNTNIFEDPINPPQCIFTAS